MDFGELDALGDIVLQQADVRYVVSSGLKVWDELLCGDKGFPCVAYSSWVKGESSPRGIVVVSAAMGRSQW